MSSSYRLFIARQQLVNIQRSTCTHQLWAPVFSRTRLGDITNKSGHEEQSRPTYLFRPAIGKMGKTAAPEEQNRAAERKISGITSG